MSTAPTTPLAVLDIAEVTRAVEEYVRVRRPDLLERTQSHGVMLSDNGHFRWSLHEERLNGMEVRETTRTLRREPQEPASLPVTAASA